MRRTKEHRRHPVYYDKPYANNLWLIKRELGLSNKSLGELCGLNYNTIARIERGDQPISEAYKDLIETSTGYKIEIYQT